MERAEIVESSNIQGLPVEVVHLDGGAAVVTFIGSEAFHLARSYTEWKNGKGSAKLFVVRGNGRLIPSAVSSH